MIQVPSRAGQVCTLLRSELTATELANCTLMTARAYTPFYRNPQPGYLSGANVMDIAVIGIMAGFMENNRAGNASRIADAYRRVHLQALVQPADRVDGIKPDGSFQQHSGLIYDGKSISTCSKQSKIYIVLRQASSLVRLPCSIHPISLILVSDLQILSSL